MHKLRQDTYYFPNTLEGEELRRILARGFTEQGIPHELDTEVILVNKTAVEPLAVTLLRLRKTGKRPGEGQIAQFMKERKS